MLTICGDSICRHLDIIFRQAQLTGAFPSIWKKDNIFTIHKDLDKQNLKNYRSVSLLPICGKVFWRLTFNEIFSFS